MQDDKGISRRRVLKGAAAVALPLAVPSSVLAGAENVPPSERTTMGWIGTGGQGTRLLAGGSWAPEGGFISRDRVHVSAVCDVNSKRREKARSIVNEHYGNNDCDAYKDYRRLLAREDIDAVVIATGERWHPLISIDAARAGKDIYSEKPLTLTIREARVEKREIRRAGRVFQTGTQQRSSQAFRFACELVRNGYIGEVERAVVGVGGPPSNYYCTLPGQSEPDWLDYDMWLGQVPWRPYHEDFVFGWMGYRSCSGGGMTNWGAHHFDIAQWGLGKDHTGPKEINPPGHEGCDVLTYRYEDGKVITRNPGRLQQELGRGNGVLFIGSEGKVGVWRYQVKTWPEKVARVTIDPDEERLYKSNDHYGNFLDCIRSRSRPVSDIGITHRSISICHLGNIAYWLDRPLEWNPRDEHFVDGPVADRMLSRKKRSPWHL